MRNLALGIALGASLISTAALAGEQRPTHIAFSAPKAAAEAPALVPAAPKVAKRQKALGAIPLWIPIVGVVAIAGFVAAVSGGDNGSPG